MTCTTHYHACNCREQRITVLIKAALDAAYELKAISNIIDCVAHDEKIKLDGLNSRLYAACEALGPEPAEEQRSGIPMHKDQLPPSDRRVASQWA